jgi:hypothetical protein
VDIITGNSVCAPSEDVVVREIEGELIIVPLTSGIGDMEDELYSLNSTGMAIWSRFDGKRSIREIAADLGSEFEASENEIEQDVVGLATELLKRNMLIFL